MEIPHEQINKETLNKMLSSFVTREGTDYGDQEWSLEEKVQHVHRQLTMGFAVITFCPETETFNIIQKN